MVVGIDNQHIHIGKHIPYVEGCGPRGFYLNIKSLLFLSNRGSQVLIIYNNKNAPYFEGCGPQGPKFKFKGSAFSKQPRQPLGSTNALIYIFRPHRTRMWGLGPVLIYDGPALPNQTWQPLAFFYFYGVVHPPCDLHACSFQHQGYMDGLVQA